MFYRLIHINSKVTLDLSKVGGIFPDLNNNSANKPRSMIIYEDKFISMDNEHVENLKDALDNYKKENRSQPENPNRQ